MTSMIVTFGFGVLGVFFLFCCMMFGGSAVSSLKRPAAILAVALVLAAVVGMFGVFVGAVISAMIAGTKATFGFGLYQALFGAAFFAATVFLPVFRVLTGKCLFQTMTEFRNSPDAQGLSKGAMIGRISRIMLSR